MAKVTEQQLIQLFQGKTEDDVIPLIKKAAVAPADGDKLGIDIVPVLERLGFHVFKELGGATMYSKPDWDMMCIVTHAGYTLTYPEKMNEMVKTFEVPGFKMLAKQIQINHLCHYCWLGEPADVRTIDRFFNHNSVTARYRVVNRELFK